MYKLAIILVLGLLGLFSAVFAEDTLHDPTRPASYSEDTTTDIANSDIKITAIFVGKDHKVVMIGNHSFTIGEKISGSTITAIDKDGITLKNEDGSEFRVTMPYSTIKLPITNNEKKDREKLD